MGQVVEEQAVDPVEALARIARKAHALPVSDARVAEDILGYDDHGMPS